MEIPLDTPPSVFSKYPGISSISINAFALPTLPTVEYLPAPLYGIYHFLIRECTESLYTRTVLLLKVRRFGFLCFCCPSLNWMDASLHQAISLLHHRNSNTGRSSSWLPNLYTS